MDKATRLPGFWEMFSEKLNMKNMPSAELRLSPFSPLIGKVQADEGLPDNSRGAGGPIDYMVTLQLRAIPFAEQFLGARKVSSGFYPVGGVSVLNLQERPAVAFQSPFDTLVFHVTQASLNEVAYELGARRAEPLVWPFGRFDPVVYNLGQTLVASLLQPNHASKIFVDHVLHALNCHFVSSYGGITVLAPHSRGGLSAQQIRKAAEFLEDHLDGDLGLQQVAQVCDLSLSHFARAFKQSFRKPPHQWLIERRVDRAKRIMLTSRMPLADVAIRCGFADQSALNRAFKRIHGVPPGIWRRTMTPESRGPGRDRPDDLYATHESRHKYEAHP